MQKTLNFEGDISMRESIHLKGAHSFSNGIMFYSTSNPDYVTIVTIDENQNIKTEWLPKKVLREYEESKKAERETEKEAKKNKIKNAEFEVKKNAIINTTIFLVFTLPAFILYVLFDTVTYAKVQKEIFSSLRSFFLGFVNPKFLLITLLVFIVAVILWAFVSSYIDANTARFHAAEHMISNAYSKLHRVPSIEELSQYSRFHRYCGSNYLVLVLIICIVVLSHLLFNVNILLCLNIIVVSSFLDLLGLLSFVQLITTKTPTEMELEVAIIGMEAWIQNEQKDKENNPSNIS